MEITNGSLKSFKKRKFPKQVIFKPIGIVQSPFKNLKGIPIQSIMSEIKGKIEVFPQYIKGLKDLEGFSHIFCLYVFDMVRLPVPLQSKPFLQDDLKGVFAIRTPFRPNPIGLSVLQILKIKDNIIDVNNLDILDKTPVIDIKPYIPQFDIRTTHKVGWLKDNINDMKS